MNETCNEAVCNEKFENMKKDIEQLKTGYEKLEGRVNENEKMVNQIDSQLSIKLIQLEAKLDVHTKIVGEKVDNLAKEVEKKMDEYFIPSNKTTDSFKEWLQKFGMKLFEWGVYGGILYAVAKGLKLI